MPPYGKVFDITGFMERVSKAEATKQRDHLSYVHLESEDVAGKSEKSFRTGYYFVGGPVSLVNGSCAHHATCTLHFNPHRPRLGVLDEEQTKTSRLEAGDEITIVYSCIPVEGTRHIVCGIRDCQCLVISN